MKHLASETMKLLIDCNYTAPPCCSILSFSCVITALSMEYRPVLSSCARSFRSLVASAIFAATFTGACCVAVLCWVVGCNTASAGGCPACNQESLAGELQSITACNSISKSFACATSQRILGGICLHCYCCKRGVFCGILERLKLSPEGSQLLAMLASIQRSLLGRQRSCRGIKLSLQTTKPACHCLHLYCCRHSQHTAVAGGTLEQVCAKRWAGSPSVLPAVQPPAEPPGAAMSPDQWPASAPANDQSAFLVWRLFVCVAQQPDCKLGVPALWQLLLVLLLQAAQAGALLVLPSHLAAGPRSRTLQPTCSL